MSGRVSTGSQRKRVATTLQGQPLLRLTQSSVLSTVIEGQIAVAFMAEVEFTTPAPLVQAVWDALIWTFRLNAPYTVVVLPALSGEKSWYQHP